MERPQSANLREYCGWKGNTKDIPSTEMVITKQERKKLAATISSVMKNQSQSVSINVEDFMRSFERYSKRKQL
jgi:hypothetical protein